MVKEQQERMLLRTGVSQKTVQEEQASEARRHGETQHQISVKKTKYISAFAAN